MKKKIAEIVKSLKDITGNVALSYEDQQRIDEIIEELESIEPQRVLISKELTAEQRFSLIEQFHSWYYNTDASCEEFGPEFYSVVDDIMHNKIPIKLRHLTDYHGLLIDVIPELEADINAYMSEV